MVRKQAQSAFLVLLLLVVALPDAGVFAVCPPPQNLVVTKLADTNDGVCDSDCSLREAIGAATSCGDTITFGVTGTITLTMGPLTIDTSRNDLHIDGPGSDMLTISGNNSSGVFDVTGLDIEIVGLTLTGGSATDGGGINNAGTLSVDSCSISGNAATGMGGGIYNSGSGTLSVVNSSIGNNSAGTGGGIRNDGSLELANTTVHNNSAVNGGGLYNSSNAAVVNNTFSGNAATGTGGGIYNHTTGTLALMNTIIADSASGGDCTNSGTIPTNVKNLIEDSTCVPDFFGDPMLGTLTGNPAFFPLLGGSSAIDNGDATACASPPVDGVDQREMTRPQGAGCDIGAYELKYRTINAVAYAGGTISPSGSVKIEDGADQSFIITPDAGYQVLSVFVNGVHVGAPTTYDFIDVSKNYSIVVYFTKNSYTINASAGVGGSISPSGSISVSRGGSQSFSIAANAGYSISHVVVDGVSLGAVGSHTFLNVTANHSISVTFVPNTYRIRVITYGGGFVSLPGGEPINPGTDITVPRGGNKTFNITPHAAHTLIRIDVNGVSQGAPASYTFTNVQRNYVLVAYFGVSITASVSGAGGTISPSGTITAFVGGNYRYTITANSGYHISNITVNGTSLGSSFASPYEHVFNNVQSNSSIVATFTPDTFPITASAGAGGAITDPGTTQVVLNGSKSYTVTANAGYYISDIKVDGVSLPGPYASPYVHSFTNVITGHSISASFTPLQYTIKSAALSAGGTIDPAGTTTVSRGGNQDYLITADPGYRISNIIVNGVSIGTSFDSPYTYSFTNVTSNRSIYVYFVLD